MHSRSNHLLRNYANNIHLIQLQPKEVKILAKRIGCSQHGISGTRWSDRVESVKQFVAHLPGVKLALEDLLEMNLTPKTRNKIHGAICNVSSFTSIIMPVMWYRKLVPVDLSNKVIQASDATSGIKIANTESLLAQLVALRDS